MSNCRVGTVGTSDLLKAILVVQRPINPIVIINSGIHQSLDGPDTSSIVAATTCGSIAGSLTFPANNVVEHNAKTIAKTNFFISFSKTLIFSIIYRILNCKRRSLKLLIPEYQASSN